MKQSFIDASLDVLDRQVRDNIVDCPTRSPMHLDLWQRRLHTAFEQPIWADHDECARHLTTLDAALRRQRVTIHYYPAQGAEPTEHGRWRTDGTMWIRPNAPARMLQVMAHECGHMMTQLILGHCSYADLDDRAHEVVAESTSFVVMRALGIDTLDHSAAYVTNNYCNAGIPVGALRDLTRQCAQAILRCFSASDLKGVS